MPILTNPLDEYKMVIFGRGDIIVGNNEDNTELLLMPHTKENKVGLEWIPDGSTTAEFKGGVKLVFTDYKSIIAIRQLYFSLGKACEQLEEKYHDEIVELLKEVDKQGEQI